MLLDQALQIFSEHMEDCSKNVKSPRHAHSEELFLAMRRLAIEYMGTKEAGYRLHVMQYQAKISSELTDEEEQ